MSRRTLYWALMGILVLGTAKWDYLHFLRPDLTPAGIYYEQYPDAGTPTYPRFLDEVRARTRAGDSIAILVPMRTWDGGYAYAFYRATYFLTGRTVVPLVDDRDRLHLDQIPHVDYIASWRMEISAPGFDQVWTSAEGRLMRRRK